MPERSERTYLLGTACFIRLFAAFGHNKLCPYREWSLIFTRHYLDTEPTLNQGIKAINSNLSPRPLHNSKRRGDFFLHISSITRGENRKRNKRQCLQSAVILRHLFNDRKQIQTFSFQIQKAIFYLPKGRLSSAKRAPFARRLTAFCNDDIA